MRFWGGALTMFVHGTLTSAKDRHPAVHVLQPLLHLGCTVCGLLWVLYLVCEDADANYQHSSFFSPGLPESPNAREAHWLHQLDKLLFPDAVAIVYAQ